MKWEQKGSTLECTTKAGTLTFDMAGFFGDVWAAMGEPQKACAVNGMKQKIADRAAIGRDPETGASATDEEKFAAMQETAERLQSGGAWNTVAVGTGIAVAVDAGGMLQELETK